jgi:hypothetical protein
MLSFYKEALKIIQIKLQNYIVDNIERLMQKQA